MQFTHRPNGRYKCFCGAKTLAQGGIHFRRASSITGVPTGPDPWGANGNIQAVMDGDIDGFITAYLTANATGELKK